MESAADMMGTQHGIQASNVDLNPFANATEAPVEPPLPGFDALVRLCRRLSGAHDEEQVLSVLAEEFLQTIGTRIAHILLFADNPRRLVTGRLISVGSALEQAPVDVPMEDDDMVAEILEGDHVVVVEDARTDPRPNPNMVAHFANKSIIAIPLFGSHGRVGVINTGTFGNEPVLRLRQPHIDYLIAVGQYAAMALDAIEFRESKRRTEASLFRANELLQASLRSVSETVVIVDATGQIEFVNAAGEALAALPREQLQGSELKDAFHLLDEYSLARVDSLDVSGADMEYSPRLLALHDRSGQIHLVQCGTVAIHDAQGNPQGMVVLIRDATRLPDHDSRSTVFGLASDGGEAVGSPHARVRRLQQRMDEQSALVDQAASTDHPNLADEITERERDCIDWCARGKTAWETGQILGISEWTVVYHLNRTKRRFGLTRKHQLVARAVSLGVISRP